MELGTLEREGDGARDADRIAPELLSLPPAPARQRTPRTLAVLAAAAALIALAIFLTQPRIEAPGPSGRTAMTDARQAAQAIEMSATESAGGYDSVTVEDVRRLLPAMSDRLELRTTLDSYVVTVAEPGDGVTFSVSRGTDGSTRFTCAPPGGPSCPPTGEWP